MRKVADEGGEFRSQLLISLFCPTPGEFDKIRTMFGHGGRDYQLSARAATMGLSKEGEVKMRWGDPLIGRMELYFLMGVIALLAAAHVIRAVVG
jgi:hypothetical protein